MRKNEADFTTKFFSEAGTRLKNNDYFGYVELDNYVIWAVADGFDEEEGANVVSKLAVDSAIEYFLLRPRFNVDVIKEMFEYANEKVKEKQEEIERYSLMHTSLLIIISNYHSFLYGNVGNTRFYHISSGYIISQSKDDTIAQLLVEENALNVEDIKYHRQRNDLLQAIGDFGKIKANIIKNPVELKENDILCLTTIGFWENVMESEIESELSRNSEEKWLKSLEQKIMGTVRENIENYTFIAIKINKIASPEPIEKDKKKLLKKIIIIGSVLIFIILIFTFFNINKKNKILKQIVVYEQKANAEIEKKNFNNAIEEFKLEIDEYRKLLPKNNGIIAFLTNSKLKKNEIDKKIENVKKNISETEKLQQIFQNINEGNEFFNNGNYDEASQKYQKAKYGLEENNYKRDEMNSDEIMKTLETRIESSAKLKEAKMIEIAGDNANNVENYNLAKENYKNASQIYLENGKVDYISKIEKKIDEINEKAKISYNGATLVENKADMLSQMDMNKAREAYYEARKIYQTLGDSVKTGEIDNKIQELNARQMASLETANNLVQEGLNQIKANNPAEAISLMTKAKNIYDSLNDANNSKNVDKYILQAQEFIKFESETEKKMVEKLAEQEKLATEKFNEYEKMMAEKFAEQEKTTTEKISEKDKQILEIQNSMTMRENEMRLKEEEIEKEKQKRLEIDRKLRVVNELEMKGEEMFAKERYFESIEKYDEAKKNLEEMKNSGEFTDENRKIEFFEKKIAKSEVYLNEKEGDEALKEKKKDWKKAEEKYKNALEKAKETEIESEVIKRIEKKLKKATKKANKKWWQFWKL